MTKKGKLISSLNEKKNAKQLLEKEVEALKADLGRVNKKKAELKADLEIASKKRSSCLIRTNPYEECYKGKLSS